MSELVNQLRTAAAYLSLKSNTGSDKMLTNAADEIERLQVWLDAALKDRAFYKSCALSGEVPKDGDEPSAQGEPK